MRRFIDRMWSFFKLGVVALVISATAIGVYLYVHMDDEVGRQVEAELAKRFPQLEIEIGSARIAAGRGIVVERLSLATTLASGQREQVLSIDQATLLCDVSVGQLLQGSPQIRGIEIERPQLWLKRMRSGVWNAARLKPVCSDTPCPPIVVRHGALSVGDEGQPHLPPLAVDDIAFTVTPHDDVTDAASCPDRCAARLKIVGALSGRRLGRCGFEASVAPDQGECTAQFDVDGLQIVDETQAWLSAVMPPSLRESRLTAVVDGAITLQLALGRPEASQFDVRLKIRTGRVEDERLSRPIIELTGEVEADRRQLRITNLQGSWGDATGALSLTRNGWGAQAPMAIAAQIRHVALDRPLYQSLPFLLRQEWDKFLPEGEVDAEIQAVFDGRRWLPTALLRGRNLAFEAEKFRYRLHQGSGALHYFPAHEDQPPRIEIDILGQGGGQPLHIVGRVYDPQPEAAGWIEITGRDIEIERAMIDALPEKPREVIGSLHPAGRFDLHWRLERTFAGQEKPRKTLHLDLRDLEINYDRFAYPLRGIEGTITATDDHWEFKQLESGGRRVVRCEGRLDVHESGSELALHIEGEQTPLDDDLFEALPEPVQRAWTELQARGHVDFHAEVNHRTGMEKANIRAVIRPRAETTQIKPRFFDYLMEGVAGTIVYQDGEISLDEMRAAHDRTKMGAEGNGYFSPDGSWQFQLTRLHVDKLTPREDLLAALPRSLRRVVDQLKPTGYFSLSNGTLAFRRAALPVAPVEASWNLQLDCHQTDLQTGVELKNINGEVRLAGAYDGQRAFTSGELDLDAVTFQNVAFTQVKGPIWADQSQCRLGQWAAEPQGSVPRRLTAVAYDGAVAADAWVVFDAMPKYAADVDWVGADVDRLVAERFGSTTRFGGKVDAKLALYGEGRQLASLIGKGDVRVRDAKIYELPMLLSMLKLLRTGSADSTAFDRSEIKFRLTGQNIYLDQVDFLGDVVNLYGKGYTNFDQEIKAVFHGVVGRSSSRFPFVKNVVGKVNQQFLEMYVDGNLSDPHVTTEALPNVKRFLEQIQTDLASPPLRSLQR